MQLNGFKYSILKQMQPINMIMINYWDKYRARQNDLTHLLVSLDLNPCDFFLWGYLKSKVYSNRPQSIEKLKDTIRQEITAIPHEMTRRVIDNFRERLRQCVHNNGSHLTDLIFKT